MKYLLSFIAFFLFLNPILAHAVTLTPTVSANPIFSTQDPTVKSSTFKDFSGCEQWGNLAGDTTKPVQINNPVAYFKCQIDATTIRYCQVTSKDSLSIANGYDGTCDDVDTSAEASGSVNDVKVRETVSAGKFVTTETSTDAAGNATTTSGFSGQTHATLSQSTAVTQDCSIGDFKCYLTEDLAGILQSIMYWFMLITGFFLGIVGVLFNWLIIVTVFQFGSFFGNSQGMLLAWGILRDVGNILILFGFIYAGVMMVLDLHSFDARKAIPRLIIFAVLLNFSLFAGEAIVDVSNVLSAKLYQQAGQSVFQKCDNTADLTNCTNQVGIAEVIIQDTGIGSSYSFGGTSAAADVNANSTDHLHVLLAYIGVTILMSIVMILLLAASVMFLVRAITLVILLVTSPIGFAGLAIPQLESQAQKWWQALFSNAFFAPIFLLLLFVGLKVMDGLRGAVGDPTNSTTLIQQLTNPSVSIGSVLIIFALITGFFLAALMFAKSSGAAGAQFATTFAQKTVVGAWQRVGNGAAGIGRSLGAAGYRNTVGKGAAAAGNGYNTAMGKLQNSKNFKWVASTARVLGVDDTIENGIHSLQTQKVLGRRSYADHNKHVAERTSHLNHAAHQADLVAAMKAGIDKQGNVMGENTAEYAAAERAIQEMSIDDAKKIISGARSEALTKMYGKMANADKFAKLMEDKDLDGGLKSQLSEGRFSDYHGLKGAFDAAKEKSDTSGSATDLDATQAAFKALQDNLDTFSEKDFESALLYDTTHGVNNAEETFGLISPDGKGNSVIKNGDIRKNLIKKSSISRPARKIIYNAEKSEQLKGLMDKANAGGSGAGAAVAQMATLMRGTNMKRDVAEVGEDKIFRNGGLTTAGLAFVGNLDNTEKLKGLTEKGLSREAYRAIVDQVQAFGTRDQRDMFKTFLKGNNAQTWSVEL